MQQLSFDVCFVFSLDIHLEVNRIFDEVLSNTTKSVYRVLPKTYYCYLLVFGDIISCKFVASPKVVKGIFLFMLPLHKEIYVATCTNCTLT